jgi:transcriptional regulator with XRE-family HTH domain
MSGEGADFGTYLRQLRLAAGFGLRAFAQKIEMQPSNLCNMEAGRIAPPQSAETMRRITRALGLEANSEESKRLNNLAVAEKPGTIPPDIAEYVAEQPAIPLLLRSVQGKQLDEQGFRELAAFIESHFRQRPNTQSSKTRIRVARPSAPSVSPRRNHTDRH